MAGLGPAELFLSGVIAAVNLAQFVALLLLLGELRKRPAFLDPRRGFPDDP